MLAYTYGLIYSTSAYEVCHVCDDGLTFSRLTLTMATSSDVDAIASVQSRISSMQFSCTATVSNFNISPELQ